MNWSLILGLIQTVLTVVSDGTLSQSKKQTAISYLNFAGQLLDSGDVTEAEFKWLSDRVKTGEPITEEEWDSLKTRSDAAYRSIQDS